MGEPHFRCLATDSSTLALGCWHADGTISDANNSLLTLLRCTREDIQAGRIRWKDVTPPEFAELDIQALEEVRLTGECTPFEKEYIRGDGRRVPVLVGGTVFGNGISDAGAFYAVDLSQRKTITRSTEEIVTEAVCALTERQRIVCLLLSYGDNDKQIATVLDQGLRTIEAEKQRVAKRLGIKTSGVALWAADNRRALISSLQQCGRLPNYTRHGSHPGND